MPLEKHLVPFQRTTARYTVHRLRDPMAFMVIGVCDRVRPVRRGGELPPLLPGETETVIITEGVPYRVIADRVPVIRRQLVLPVTVRIGIGVRNCRSPCYRASRLVCVFGCGCDVPAEVVGIDDGLIEIKVVFPDQLVQIVVIVFLSLYPSFGYCFDVPETVNRNSPEL